MLTLYHYWSSVCSQKARHCLAEKGLTWESRHINLFTFDQWAPDYVKLNHKAVVPTLDHDGRVLIESNVICEYLDEAFDGPRLNPADPYDRGRMRLWLYDSEEIGHPNINLVSYNPRHRPRLAGLSRAEQEQMATRIPNPVIRARWLKRVAEGVSKAEEDDAFGRLGQLLDRMEADLAEAPWLAGATFSLADVTMAPFINRLEALERGDLVAASERPRIADWWARVQDRPAFREAYSFPNPNPSDWVKR